MKRRIPVVMILVLGLTLVLVAGLYGQVKKDAATGMDRIEGTILTLDKGKSTLSLKQSRGSGAAWQVAYNDKTVITLRNEPAKIEDLKEGLRVVVLGKYEQNALNATRIDIRTEK